MNSVSISGNLGKDCEVRHLPTGDMVCGFSVADNMLDAVAFAID